MCRLLGYLGCTIPLERILSDPPHSLIVQSYQPREMREALLNADGFGLGWYHATQQTDPFTYKNIFPAWSDLNLKSLGRYIESERILAYVRSATPGQAVNLTNCQPFQFERLLFVHNGYIKEFRTSLYRLIRNRLRDSVYQNIEGTTDSEHIFGLLINELTSAAQPTLTEALHTTLMILQELGELADVKALVNVIICDGQQMVASRFAVAGIPPSLYYLQNDPKFPQSVIIASEPLFPGNWYSCPEQSIITVGENLDIHIEKLA
ncbi:ergothioneine biosynthesis protein EgtC [Limnoraphis robusta Tam1]|uniref:ergothioneine biosynthesis protein EgtC n=1 Tax=Limnoraphis robusta TaxID=1118279 RepID=UPI002B20FCE6|nr:ergothioneine biosynthesis protein EgtC [Limnoraphis robusta]MEA5541240.1 ergothioneine biosynthesis protein EgtC [Limnoraphis robusta Tam1]